MEYYSVEHLYEKKMKGQKLTLTERWAIIESLMPHHKEKLYKYQWKDVISEPIRLFELWKSLPCYFLTYPEGCIRANTDPEMAAVLAVDASPKGAGGLFFEPLTDFCLTYKLDVLQHLGVPYFDDPSVTEMFNILYSLFLFKQKIVNLKVIRILTDNNKINNPRKCALVQTIYKIFDWLVAERNIVIVNNSLPNYKLQLRKDKDAPFMKLADCLSKKKIFQKDMYPIFNDIYITELPEKLIKKYYSYF